MSYHIPRHPISDTHELMKKPTKFDIHENETVTRIPAVFSLAAKLLCLDCVKQILVVIFVRFPL